MYRYKYKKYKSKYNRLLYGGSDDTTQDDIQKDWQIHGRLLDPTADSTLVDDGYIVVDGRVQEDTHILDSEIQHRLNRLHDNKPFTPLINTHTRYRQPTPVLRRTTSDKRDHEHMDKKPKIKRVRSAGQLPITDSKPITQPEVTYTF